ncbi:hypothetical protein [Escherichia coli]
MREGVTWPRWEFELKHGLLTGKGTADETLHKTVKLTRADRQRRN